MSRPIANAFRQFMPMIVGLMFSVPAGYSQTIPAQESPNGPYTLHVYTDLLEIPTLVQTPLHSTYGFLTKESFRISLGGGPDFHPTSVRMEHDDPIALGVLFDGTTVGPEMLKAAAESMSTSLNRLLSARDSISVYAYDCELVRISPAQPAATDKLRAAMKDGIAHGFGRTAEEKQASCEGSSRLYDAVARVAQELGELPGRRVLLVVSAGTDVHSVNSWTDVARYVESRSLAIFDLRPVREVLPNFRSAKELGLVWTTSVSVDRMGSLCASSGGLILSSDASEAMLESQIGRLIRMVRERYILEFPRPRNGAPGDFYSISVKIRDPRAIIRPAGIAFPPRSNDAKQPDGTLPQDRSRMPVVGLDAPEAKPH
jgi:hypothetical protein